jgi:hypothetical protein
MSASRVGSDAKAVFDPQDPARSRMLEPILVLGEAGLSPLHSHAGIDAAR